MRTLKVERHTRYIKRYIGLDKVFPFTKENPSRESNFGQQNPSGEKEKKFSRWLERVAYMLCEHCIVDDKGHHICLHIYNMPAYCLIENCPYIEEEDP